MPDVPESDLVQEGAIPPDDFHDAIERVQEVAEWDLEVPSDLGERLLAEAASLLIAPALLAEAAAALVAGHLVLQGPPGTGKSSLARALCRAFNTTVLPVTAHEDWSTFELIGRQELRVDPEGRESIVGVNGFFTEAVIRCAGSIVRHFDDQGEPQACWLLIDELNRAHLDKAFGELFTVLGTDELVSITLPHQRVGNNELITPRRFRVLATLNSIDKQFVNSLSQGLRRRFTFVTVDIPGPRSEGEAWGSAAADASHASREFTTVVERAVDRLARKVTPAGEESEAARQQLSEVAFTRGRGAVEALFNLAERVRYAGKSAGVPHLPIGTAQLIDTVEAFLSRQWTDGLENADPNGAMDWAASVKVAPLFDADSIDPGQLEEFAMGLDAPFSERTRRELLQIVAAGLYFCP